MDPHQPQPLAALGGDLWAPLHRQEQHGDNSPPHLLPHAPGSGQLPVHGSLGSLPNMAGGSPFSSLLNMQALAGTPRTADVGAAGSLNGAGGSPLLHSSVGAVGSMFNPWQSMQGNQNAPGPSNQEVLDMLGPLPDSALLISAPGSRRNSQGLDGGSPLHVPSLIHPSGELDQWFQTHVLGQAHALVPPMPQQLTAPHGDPLLAAMRSSMPGNGGPRGHKRRSNGDLDTLMS